MVAALPPSLRDREKKASGPAGPKPEAMPMVLYAECGPTSKFPFAYSGWMGDTEQIEFDPCWAQDPHKGNTCIRFSFVQGEWGGIVWQYPANDWGDIPDGLNLSEAKELTFYARGNKGSEQVKFEMGILGTDKKYPDSGTASLTILLSKRWKKYTISLKGKDLRCIKTGFSWSTLGKGDPVTFFVDDVQYE